MKEIEYSTETVRLVEQGRLAWTNLKTGTAWTDWRLIGFAIEAARADIRISLGINDPDSKLLKNEMGQWLRVSGFNEIDKSTRSRLSSCMAHIGEIDRWREQLEPAERTRLNHPHGVWLKFKQTLEDGVDRPKKPNAKDLQIELLENRLAERDHVITTLQNDVLGLTDQLRDAAWDNAASPKLVADLAANAEAIRETEVALAKNREETEELIVLRDAHPDYKAVMARAEKAEKEIEWMYEHLDINARIALSVARAREDRKEKRAEGTA